LKYKPLRGDNSNNTQCTEHSFSSQKPIDRVTVWWIWNALRTSDRCIVCEYYCRQSHDIEDKEQHCCNTGRSTVKAHKASIIRQPSLTTATAAEPRVRREIILFIIDDRW